jgi:hypothetical protein
MAGIERANAGELGDRGSTLTNDFVELEKSPDKETPHRD